MASDSIDYEAVIADLEAKRAAFNTAVDAAIGNIRYVLTAVGAITFQGLPPTVTVTGPGPGSAGISGSAVTPDMLFGLSIAEAAMKYLAIVKRQQTTRDITDALEKAGYHHTSQNFLNTVNTALYRREKDDGDVVKIGRNWALSEWYLGRRKGVNKRSEMDDSAAETEVTEKK